MGGQWIGSGLTVSWQWMMGVEAQAGEAWVSAEWRRSMRITIEDYGLRPPNRSDSQAPLSSKWSDIDSFQMVHPVMNAVGVMGVVADIGP